MVDMAGLWCDLAPETRCSTKPTEQPRFILVPKVVNQSNSQAFLEKAFPFAKTMSQALLFTFWVLVSLESTSPKHHWANFLPRGTCRRLSGGSHEGSN